MKRFQDKSIDLIITSPPYNFTPRKGGPADVGKLKEY
jgi:DNA modification methylase